MLYKHGFMLIRVVLAVNDFIFLGGFSENWDKMILGGKAALQGWKIEGGWAPDSSQGLFPAYGVSSFVSCFL